MRILYRAIDFVADLLRKHVKTDSWLRNGLRGINEIIGSFRYHTVNRHVWQSNYNKFEGTIERYSSEIHDFFVLQLGACDGVMDDPIHQWINRNRWHGLLVEPQIKEFERLRNNYRHNSNLRFANVAIAESDRLRPLYKIKDEHLEFKWQRGVASLLPKPGLEKQDMIATEIVQCVTFDTLLDCHKVKRIDLLQIDVEDYDYELLKLFDFERIKPQLIRYEHKHLNLSDKSDCKKHLKQLGYEILEMEYDSGAVLRRGES